jgi:hypothetical protein
MAKKFKDTKVGQFLNKNGSNIVDVIGSIIPSTRILSIAKELIVKDQSLPPKDKETALKLLEMDSIEMQEVSKRWNSDMTSDSWLSKNVRPMTLVFFSVSYVIGWFLDYSLENITSLVSLIIAAYFGSRGFEKVQSIKK